MTHQTAALSFLRAFLRNPTGVGAIVPSAQVLAKAMVGDLELEPGDTVLELGPGTGAFTARIQEIMPDTTGYIGIECETRFVELLEARFPNMHFVNASAENACLLISKAGLGPVRVIISSLPFTTILDTVRSGIIDALEQLMTPGCVFRTFQYVHAYPLPTAVRFRRSMSERFGNYHRSSAVLPNVPPAYVLTWRC